MKRVLAPRALSLRRIDDWRNTAVSLSERNTISAIYTRPGEAYVLVANLEPEPRKVSCRVPGDKLRDPLTIQMAELAGGARLDAAKLSTSGA
jgi:hypothetical protein